MVAAPQCDTRTTRTTGMTPLSAKRVSLKVDTQPEKTRADQAGLPSVCELCHDPGDQAYHQGKRDHEVRYLPPPDADIPNANPTREDDSKWPQKNKDGRQELEIRLGNEHISFEVWLAPRE